MNDDRCFSTSSSLEYEDLGPRYSQAYLARVDHFQQLSANRNSKISVSRSGDIKYDNVDDERSVIVAPLRDFVEEDDKEAENITIPDRLCQPESPTVTCSVSNPESLEIDHVVFVGLTVSEEKSKSVPMMSENVKLQRQTSEEKEHTFGSLGPMNKMGQEIKDSAMVHSRSRSQVSGWAKLLASTLQRSKSTVSQDLNSNMQKNIKSRPIRKSEQLQTSFIRPDASMTHENEGIDSFVSKAEMRKKKRSIGVDMREKLGFFRKQFGESTLLTTTPNLSNMKVSAASPLTAERVWKSSGAPPTREQILSWSHSFEELLNDRHGVALFLEFLRSEFSDENLEFWSACQEYRSIDSAKDLQEKAMQIYEDYVAEQSPREINIDSVTRIQTSLDIHHANIHTFDQSQKKIQALMEKDSYQRFLRSDIYHNLETHTNLAPKSPHSHSAPSEVDAVRISYIPGLLPNVTAGSRSHQFRVNTNPSILSVRTSGTPQSQSSAAPGHHPSSAPSSPKNITQSTLS